MNILIFNLPVFPGKKRPQNTIILELTAIKTSEGTIYLSIFNSEISFNRNKPLRKMKIQPAGGKKVIKLSLPCGDYSISVARNNNSDVSSYSSITGSLKEKAAPGNYKAKETRDGFSKHKITVSEATRYLKMSLYFI